MGGRLQREGVYVYTQLVHTVVRQELTQHHNVITLQLNTHTHTHKFLFINWHLGYRVQDGLHPVQGTKVFEGESAEMMQF